MKWSKRQGKGEPIELDKFVEILEINLGKKAKKIMMPMQSGDVKETLSDCADITESSPCSISRAWTEKPQS